MADSDVTPPSVAPRKKRRVVRWLLGFLLTLALLVAAAPYVVSFPPIRDWIVDQAAAKENVRVQVGELSLGWFSPLKLGDLKVESAYGDPLLDVAEIRSDRPWWQLGLSRHRLGRFLVEKPHVTLVAKPTGWNFQGIGAKSPAGKNGGAPAQVQAERKPELTADLRNAGVVLYRAGVEAPLLDVQGVNATVSINYVDDTRWLSVQPFQPLDHKQLTPEMCDNGLQLVAPILAYSTWVDGEVSLAIDEFRLPLNRPATTDGTDIEKPLARASGRLELHSVETGIKNPLLQQIATRVATLLGAEMPSKVRLADASVVNFELRDRRVHHEGLAFGLPEIDPTLLVRTSGSVGLDKTLDLRVEVPVALNLAFKGPIAQRVSGKTVQLAVTGTLDDPKVALPPEKGLVKQFANLVSDDPVDADGAVADDVVEIAKELLPTARSATQNVMSGLAESLARVRERRAERRGQQSPTPNAQALNDSTADAVGDALPPPPPDDRVEPDVSTEEQALPDQSEAEVDAPRQGPLRRLFNRQRRNRSE